MLVDLVGRIKTNTKLPVSKALHPLFEAVINSIHAIEEARTAEGRIEIRIERDTAQLALSDQRIAPVENFLVTDNGVGFTERNYKSFETSDSRLKSGMGGKGVGRFLWLKAFENVHVESSFYEGDSLKRRVFDFRLCKEGVVEHSMESSGGTSSGTAVKLEKMKRQYQDRCPPDVEVVSRSLLQHCMIYFIKATCPEIVVADDEKRIVLNRIFEEYMKAATDRFSVEGHDFIIQNLKLYAAGRNKHKLHLCAHDREVREENLALSIPDLQKKIRESDGEQFVLASYVSGDLLDQSVDAERFDFSLDDSSTGVLPGMITLEDIKTGAIKQVESFLRPYLEEIRGEKFSHIETFVQNKAPQYRPVLIHGKSHIEKIPPGLADDKLDIELHRAKMEIVKEMKEEGAAILKTDPKDVKNIEAYMETYNRFARELNDIAKSELAQYIVHRKLVLDLLLKELSFNGDGKYGLEEAVHRLVFPLRTTSDEIDYENQNLWVIDERLSYHKYLSSDRRLDKVEAAEIEGGARPDLLIFNAPFAFVGDDSPFSSVVVLEFKRPLRDDYDAEKNPIAQVYGYIRKIRDGKAKDRNGRPIPIPKSMPFYCYIICDLTSKMQEQAENASLITTPDELGFFGYNTSYNAYIEIISYQKLLTDAKKRNQILFDKLHLPH